MLITYDYLGMHGQLGNQMFQYAILLGIKYKTDARIIFNQEVKNRSYLFDFFELTEYEIDETLISDTYQEINFNFNPEVFDIKNNKNFRGYFQTEKYFKHCEHVVRNEFVFKQSISDRVDTFLQEYSDRRLVSLHVRRGDYLVNPDAHPLCSIEYYNQAMDMLDGDDVQFICTSNDIQWCKENIKRNNIVYNFSDLSHDICLISKCDDHIIANSTFSWWGSWLGKSPNKKIIAPSVWFGPRFAHLDVSDLYCDNFIKL